MAAETTSEVRILPTLWTGVATSTSWGVTSLHHPEYHLHAELEPEWRNVVDFPLTMEVLRQSGRNLELLFMTGNHESRAVETLLSDGTAMVVADATSSTRWEIKGDRMTGMRTVHDKPEASGEMRFGSGVIELQAST